MYSSLRTFTSQHGKWVQSRLLQGRLRTCVCMRGSSGKPLLPERSCRGSPLLTSSRAFCSFSSSCVTCKPHDHAVIRKSCSSQRAWRWHRRLRSPLPWSLPFWSVNTLLGAASTSSTPTASMTSRFAPGGTCLRWLPCSGRLQTE